MNVPKVLTVSASLIFVIQIGGSASAQKKKPQTDPTFTASFEADATGTVLNMNAPRGGDPIEELNASGTLYFPFNGLIGDGIGDIGDVLLELNEADSDGNGVGDLFDTDTAIVGGAVCLSGNVRIFLRDDLDALGRPTNALVSISWTGTEEKRASDYTLMVGGVGAEPKNWWVCPDRQSWPSNARLLFGVDPLIGSTNCSEPAVVGQVFRVTRHGKKGGTTIWVYGHGGAVAHIEILTTPMP